MTTTHPLLLDASWSIGDKPHGGYLLREIVGCALDADHPDPMAVSAHYLSSPTAGPATVQVERTRTGRRVAASRLRLVQDGVPKVDVLLTAGTLTGGTAFWSIGQAPLLPPVADCPRAPAERPGAPRVGQLDHVELRLDPTTAGFALGRPTGTAEIRGYLRNSDGRDASATDLLVFADALPPVTFNLGLTGWVPTLELTVLVRGRAAPGWLRAVQRARLLADGWLDEECEIWDSAGRLVVQARQLAGYRENHG